MLNKIKELVKKYEYNQEFDPYILLEEVENWPMIPAVEYNEEEDEINETGEVEELDVENWYIKEITKDYFDIVCGGDWQDTYLVRIINKGDSLSVKEYYKYEFDYDEAMDMDLLLEE